MTVKRDKKYNLKPVLEAYHQHRTIQATSKATGISRSTIRRYLRAAGIYDDRPLFAGRVAERLVRTRPLPEEGEVTRYVLSCIQNNTRVNDAVWSSMTHLLDHYDAELIVGTFSYNKSSYGPKAVKSGTKKASDSEKEWYDPLVEPFIQDEPLELAPGLQWCGEMNILPTAVRPLQGLEVYTGRKSGIYPHVKIQMDSIASGKYEPTKFNYTTGTLTNRNYLQKKAGLKAEFHHCYGGLLVEVNSDGDWFCRQLDADKSGTIYDLNLKFTPEGVTDDHRPKTMVWGDIHKATIDPVQEKLIWGQGGMLDTLKPEHQMMHDLLDFRARNTHTIKRGLIHDRFEAYIKGHDSVEQEVEEVADFLNQARRPWCKTTVVGSNHDQFMVEWLRIGDYRQDPVNAIYFLEAQLHMYKSIAESQGTSPNLLKWAVQRMNGVDKGVRFLDEDESLILCKIEHGMHGNKGPNGARASITNLARMGHRINRGHTHSASIFEGLYTSGVTGTLDQGYNTGPSSWSHSHIITYPNGKRAIITCWNEKWRA